MYIQGHICTTYQNGQYTRPRMLGIRSARELAEGLRDFEASDEDRDYSAIPKSLRYGMAGRCVCCNHCLPCP